MKIRYAFTRADLTRAVTHPIEVGDVDLHLSQILAGLAEIKAPSYGYGLTLEIAQPSDPV